MGWTLWWCNPLLDEFPTVSETVKAIKLLSSGKTPGSNAILAGIYKTGGPPVAEKLTWVISHYVEKRSHPSRIQGCINYLHIQTKRESSSLWPSLGHLSIASCWEDPCKSPTERLNEHLEQSGLTRKPMWIQEVQRNKWHDLHSHAFQDSDNCIPIRYRFDGKLFNIRRLQPNSKVQTEVLNEVIFADDKAKGAPVEENMQKGVAYQVSDSCDSYDLTISIKRLDGISASALKPYKELTKTVKGQRLQKVFKFTYLGSILTRAVHIDDEGNVRIAKANAAFGRLRGSIWDRSGIKLDTKLEVYRSVVLPTLLYACKWTVYQRYVKRLNHFHLVVLENF